MREEKLKASVIVNQEEEKKKAEFEKEKREQERKAITSRVHMGKSATQKITLLGLRNISYKDLDKQRKDGFDPKMLIAEDDSDDEEYKQIMKRFGAAKEESPSPKAKGKQVQGSMSSRVVRKSVNGM